MAESASTSQQLQALRQLGSAIDSTEAEAQLSTALASQSNQVVERAAELIFEHELRAFAPMLLKAYWRLKRNPLKKDPGCLGKTAIAKALVQIEHADVDLFRDAAQTTQIEPHWTGEIDTAARLRGIAAIGLVHLATTIEVLNTCAQLLTDEWPDARMGAAQAIGALGQAEGAPLLRLKILSGDAEPEVHGECCSALLKIELAEGLAFLKPSLMASDPDRCVQTALALGDARLPGTLELLRNAWGHRGELNVRESLLLCIGLLRSTDANQFLFTLISDRDIRTATDALKALKMNGESEELRQQIQKAVERTNSQELLRIFQSEWA